MPEPEPATASAVHPAAPLPVGYPVLTRRAEHDRVQSFCPARASRCAGYLTNRHAPVVHQITVVNGLIAIQHQPHQLLPALRRLPLQRRPPLKSSSLVFIGTVKPMRPRRGWSGCRIRAPQRSSPLDSQHVQRGKPQWRQTMGLASLPNHIPYRCAVIRMTPHFKPQLTGVAGP